MYMSIFRTAKSRARRSAFRIMSCRVHILRNLMASVVKHVHRLTHLLLLTITKDIIKTRVVKAKRRRIKMTKHVEKGARARAKAKAKNARDDVKERIKVKMNTTEKCLSSFDYKVSLIC